MKILLMMVIAVSTLTTQTSFAASKRVLTCKGEGKTKGFESFRVNILLNTETNEHKATLSQGLTTQNTSETWKVKITENSEKMEIVNLNKTPFSLIILKKETASVDDIYGKEAKAKITYIARPYMYPAVTYNIAGSMACK